MTRQRSTRTPQPHMLPAAPRYLTRRQAALIAGVTERQLDRWRAEGKLRTYVTRGSSSIRIDREDLQDLISLQQMPDGQDA